MGYFTSTYQEFLQYNKMLRNIHTVSLTILDIDLRKDRVNVRENNAYGTFVDGEYEIEYLIDKIFNSEYFYLTNPSRLSNWKGFNTESFVYLNRNLISIVDKKIIEEFYDYPRNKGNYSIRFCTIKNTDNFLLRQKMAYKVIGDKLGEHFWYILDNNKKEIILLSDKQIYTPVNSEGLFSDTHFNYIDLSNVYLTNTTRFSNTFFGSYCSNINFGTHLPKTIKSLTNMFACTYHLETIDLRKWNLSNVMSLQGFCMSSRVKNLYISTTIVPSNLKYLEHAIESINLEKTNIYDIFTDKQIQFMQKPSSIFR